MEWVSTKDSQPEKTGQFLTVCKGENYLVCLYDKNQNAFYLHGSYSVPVDYWCEITSPFES